MVHESVTVVNYQTTRFWNSDTENRPPGKVHISELSVFKGKIGVKDWR